MRTIRKPKTENGPRPVSYYAYQQAMKERDENRAEIARLTADLEAVEQANARFATDLAACREALRVAYHHLRGSDPNCACSTCCVQRQIDAALARLEGK